MIKSPLHRQAAAGPGELQCAWDCVEWEAVGGGPPPKTSEFGERPPNLSARGAFGFPSVVLCPRSKWMGTFGNVGSVLKKGEARSQTRVGRMLRGSTIEGSETLLRLGKGSVLGKVWGCVRLHMDVSFLRGPPKLVCFLVVFKGTPPKKDNKQKQNRAAPYTLNTCILSSSGPQPVFRPPFCLAGFWDPQKTGGGGPGCPLAEIARIGFRRL